MMFPTVGKTKSNLIRKYSSLSLVGANTVHNCEKNTLLFVSVNNLIFTNI